jgi:hypothetical protein
MRTLSFTDTFQASLVSEDLAMGVGVTMNFC